MRNRTNPENWNTDEFVIKRNSLRKRIKADLEWLDEVIQQEEEELVHLKAKTKSFLSYLLSCR